MTLRNYYIRLFALVVFSSTSVIAQDQQYFTIGDNTYFNNEQSFTATIEDYQDSEELKVIAEASYLAYSENINSINYDSSFNLLKTRGYDLVDVVDNRDGFYALMLRRKTNRNTTEILIPIRGSEITSVEDIINDFQIALHKTPKQYKSAKAFMARVMADSDSNDHVVVTGHSLGAVLAQMLSAEFNLETTVFDSPGAKQYIIKLAGNNYDLQKIRIINSLPNPINTWGEQVTVPEAVIIDENAKICLELGCIIIGTFPNEEKPPEYLHSHRMKHILDGIYSNGTFKKADIKHWPRSSLPFYITQEAYYAMPDIYDKHIFNLWDYQYKHNYFYKYAFPAVITVSPRRIDFKTKYPTFESYRKDFVEALIKE